MRLCMRNRIQAIALLAVGFLATIASALRTYYTWLIGNGHSADVSWEAYPIYITSDIEISLGIVSRQTLMTLMIRY